MTDRVQIAVGSGLLGASVGAAVQDVSWEWWAWWLVAWVSLIAVNRFRWRDRCRTA